KGVSLQVEHKRKNGDPYYLTSNVLIMGSLLSAGNHLYLDRDSPVWESALSALLEVISQLQETYQVTASMLRDFDSGKDDKLDSIFVENGYFKISMPDNHLIRLTDWNTKEEFLQILTKRSKRHIKQDVFRHEYKYEIEIAQGAHSENILHWYKLYLNVKERSCVLNTFTLPFKVFENMVKSSDWEILIFKLKPEFDTNGERNPVAVAFNYITDRSYNFMIVGIDYRFQQEHKCYKQTIYQVLHRARRLKKEIVNLGYSASLEKQKFGANVVHSVGYMQTKDNYSLEVLSSVNVANREGGDIQLLIKKEQEGNQQINATNKGRILPVQLSVPGKFNSRKRDIFT
ncbi:MAG TPA: hypothetical protein VNX68_09015, partial [Nitrosopumilaceae archaeon]|nr:hypothetical protein [Nitrosopumilaceae archaeon]